MNPRARRHRRNRRNALSLHNCLEADLRLLDRSPASAYVRDMKEAVSQCPGVGSAAHVILARIHPTFSKSQRCALLFRGGVKKKAPSMALYDVMSTYPEAMLKAKPATPAKPKASKPAGKTPADKTSRSKKESSS